MPFLLLIRPSLVLFAGLGEQTEQGRGKVFPPNNLHLTTNPREFLIHPI